MTDIQKRLDTQWSVPDIDPLPNDHRHGLVAVSALALLSAIATSGMLCFITYRLIFWRRYTKIYLGYNQCVVLIYNLLIADFLQSIAFSLNIYWIANNKIHSPSPACFVQGLLIQVGDPGSGLFALAIALQTCMQVVLGRRLEHKWFVTGVVGIWVFEIIMAIIPTATHGGDPFAPTGAWCWINTHYENDRLWTHYIWIFLAEFGTMILYAIMFIQLRQRIAASSVLGNNSRQAESLARLRRVVSYMVIYPIAYILLSLPLAAGRMATAQGHTPSVIYFCVAGAMITSSGFVDVLMYTFTRRTLIMDSEQSEDRSNDVRAYYSKNHTQSNHFATVTATVTVDDKKNRTGILSRLQGRSTSNRRRNSQNLTSINRDYNSTENIIDYSDTQQGHVYTAELTDLGKVYQKTVIEVTSEANTDLASLSNSKADDIKD